MERVNSMDNKCYLMAGIGDVHFGACNDPERTLYEFVNEFISFLIKLPALDVVFIRGDFFDKKTALQSQTALCAMKAMWELFEVCKARSTPTKKVKIRIIRGTYFHDNDQLEIFRCYEEYNEVDFRIINTVCSEQLFPDLRVLYIPEEYIIDKEGYYGDFFSGYYDLIVGHGLIEEVKFVKQAGEMDIRRPPVFTFDELNNICRGPITFGHIHNGGCIREHFYYTGAFSTSSFGDTIPKGFDLMGYFPYDGRYFVQFIPNRLARRYDIIRFHDIWIGDIESTISNIDAYYHRNSVYKLRIDVPLPGNEVNIEIMKQYFKNNKAIQIKILISGIEADLDVEPEEELLIRNSYRDENILLEDKVQLFIKRKKDVSVPIDIIRNVLYD